MNKTSNGRWGRYKIINGESYKKCNGPLHGEDGEFMPVGSFWVYKKGPRAGKLLSQCHACNRVSKGRGADTGLVPVEKVWFVFAELEYRIGKAETLRRLGVSQNLYFRLERRIYKSMYRTTARAAMILLRELRANNIARHKDSIRHGSAIRGRKEKTPQRRNEFNGKDVYEIEYQKKKRERIKQMKQVS